MLMTMVPTAADPQATLDTVVLDETRPEGTDTAGAARSRRRFGVGELRRQFRCAAVDFGATARAASAYRAPSANGIGSGLFALDPADTSAVDGDGIGQGAQITLNQIGNTITGSAGGDGLLHDRINPGTGVVTFIQLSPIWHPTPASFDDTAALTRRGGLGLGPADRRPMRTATPTARSIDISQGVFPIQDDGPNAAVDSRLSLDTLVLDETRPVGTETDGDSSPAGLATVVANFADNFVAPVDYGSDGPGSVGYALLLRHNGSPRACSRSIAADTSPATATASARARQISSTRPATPSLARPAGRTTSRSPSTRAPAQVTFTQLANRSGTQHRAQRDDTSTLHRGGRLVSRSSRP